LVKNLEGYIRQMDYIQINVSEELFNERNNNIEIKFKDTTENGPLNPNNGLPRSVNYSQKFNDENLWKSLREALFRFEQKSQL